MLTRVFTLPLCVCAAVSTLPAQEPDPQPIPAPLAAAIPGLAAQSSWAQDTRYEGPRPDKTRRGVYPVGNGRVFTYMGLGARANTMQAIAGPSYAAAERRLPRGNFGEVEFELADTELPVQSVRRVAGANLVVTRDATGAGLALRTLTFAAPDRTTITRVVVVHNGTSAAVGPLRLVARLGGGPVTPHGAGLLKRHGRGRHAVHAVFTMADAKADGDTLTCTIASLAPGASYQTVLDITTGTGHQPAAARVPTIATATAAARATVAWWQQKTRSMPTLRTDHRKIRDLFNDWKVLMLTMRDAHSGVVSPMVTRRGAWIRQSNGPLLVFLRYNMWDEAKALLSYFYNAIRLTGAVREYYPLDLDFTALTDTETDWQKVEFPESDLLSWIVLQHFWYYRSTQDAKFIEERQPFLVECLARQKRTNGLLRFSGHENYLDGTLYSLDFDKFGTSPDFIAEDPDNDRRSFSMASSVLYLIALQGMGDMVNGIEKMHNPKKWAKDPSEVEDKPSQSWLERSLPVMQDLEKNYWMAPAHFPVCDEIEAELKIHGNDWQGFFAPAISPINGQRHDEPFANINLLPLWIGFTFPTGERSQHNLRATLGRLWHPTDEAGKRNSALVGTTATVGHFTGDVPGMLLTALIERDGRDRRQAHEDLLRIAEPAGEWGRLYDPQGRPIATEDPQWPDRLSPNECGINVDASIYALNGVRHVNIANFDNRAIKVKLRLPRHAKFLQMNNLKKDGREFNVHVDEFFAPLSAEERKQNDAQQDERYRRDPNIDHRRFRFRMELLSDNPPTGRYQVDADVSGTMFVRYLYRGVVGGAPGVIDEKEFWREDANRFFLDDAKTVLPARRELPLTEGAGILALTNREQCVELLGKTGVTYVDTGLPLDGPELVRAMLRDGKPTHPRLYLDVGFDASDRRSGKPRNFWQHPAWSKALQRYQDAGGVVLRPRYVTRYQQRTAAGWSELQAPQGRLRLGGSGPATVRCTVHANRARPDVVLRIGSGCGYKVRVNGTAIAEGTGGRRPLRDQDASLISLRQGDNTIEIDLLPDGDRELTLQVTDPSGLPAGDLRY